MILNAEQERENVRAKTVARFLNEKKAEYEARQPFNDEVQLLLNNIKRIEPLIPEKGTKGTYATEEKKEIKSSLADDVNEICTNVTTYARTTGDAQLRYAVRYRTSDITNAKDGDVLGIVTIITNAITPLLKVPGFQPYEITADTLSALMEKATAFDNSIGTAGTIDNGSSVANRQLNEVFKAIRINISNLNLLVTWFNKKNPEFVAGYHTAAAIDTSGIHHSGIFGVIKNSLTGNFVTGATLTLKGKKNTKTAFTNDDGAWEISKFVSGKAKLTVSAPNCETQVIPVTIIRGKTIELNITLQSKIINLTATA